jgi:hypothetical protein
MNLLFLNKRLLVTVFVLLFNVEAFAQVYPWSGSIGSTGDDAGASITIASDGNILTAGRFSGTVDFDPGAGLYNVSSITATDIYILKTDTAGNFLWVKTLGSNASYISVGSIKTDYSGNICITGSFQGTVDFDPGPGVYNLSFSGVVDAFMLKLDAAGNFIKAFKLGGGGQDYITSFAIDAVNNVYCTGSFGGTVDFDPGAGVYNMNSAGQGDIYILKLDSNYVLQWAKRMGNSGPDQGIGISVDNSGNVLSTGTFRSTVDFDPNAGNYPLTAIGLGDIFISKLDASGNFIWAKRIGGSGTDLGYVITNDAGNNVIIAGSASGIVDFNPGGPVYNLNAFSGFVTKLDSNGNFVWAKTTGGPAGVTPYYMNQDNTGNIYLTGNLYGKTDMDPGAGVYNIDKNVYAGGFILKLANNGIFQWASGLDYTCAIALQGNTMYRTGAFSNTADLNPGAGINNLTSAGGTDIFIDKFNYCGVIYDMNYSACDSFSLNGNTFYSSFDTVVPYMDINGCDSNQNNHIVIYPTQIFISDTACGSYTFNAQTYTQSGNYTQNSINGPGCQVTTTLNLIINQTDTTHYWQQSCIASYTLNGQTYTSTGVYQQAFTDQLGCDSAVILHLTITSCPPCIPDIVIADSLFYTDITESQTWIITSGTVLIPAGTKAKLDAFPDDYIILNPGFKAEAGSVFVAQPYNGCYAGQPQLPAERTDDNSNFIAVDEIVLYPNPTSGLIHIKHDEKLTGIQIFDMVGKLVINQKCTGETETNIDLGNLPNGVYHVKALGYTSIKVVKNNEE